MFATGIFHGNNLECSQLFSGNVICNIFNLFFRSFHSFEMHALFGYLILVCTAWINTCILHFMHVCVHIHICERRLRYSCRLHVSCWIFEKTTRIWEVFIFLSFRDVPHFVSSENWFYIRIYIHFTKWQSQNSYKHEVITF